MKKVISIILSVALLVTGLCIPVGAAGTEQKNTVSVKKVSPQGGLDSVFAEGSNALIVFVTGIGQSWSYLFDESYLAEDAFEEGTLQDYDNYVDLVENEKYIADWNLFNNYFDESFDKPTIKAIIKVALALIGSLFTRTNMVKEADLKQIATSLFRYNIVDKDTQRIDKRVVTPRYVMPLSEWPTNTEDLYDGNGNLWRAAGTYSHAKRHFYSSIPCAEIAEEKLGANYEDYLYCYNFCAFSYCKNNVEGLKTFLDTITADNKVGARDVVLVPMSMGGSVVSAYLAQYPNAADNHVRRVVSIVGCWDGSEILPDLINKAYADNSRDLFYNGIIADMIGQPWGYVVNWALRLFSHKSLRDLVDEVVGVLCDELVLKTPSLMALIPSSEYPSIRGKIASQAVLEQTDYYYNAQKTLRTRLEALEEQGIPVYFISGYGLPYGACTSDYTAFGFMKHSATTNSDEIIDICSTAPGTSFVTPGQKIEGTRVSPDGEIDAGTAYYPDKCWYFYQQKHELEQNNNAIRLAIEIALGNITCVQDCDDADEDAFYFPQFNGSRDIKRLNNDYIPDYLRWTEDNEPTAEQAALYEEVVAMKNSTVNNRAEDDALIAEFYNMLADAGVSGYSVSAPKKEGFFDKLLRKNNDFVANTVGSRGFLDFFD